MNELPDAPAVGLLARWRARLQAAHWPHYLAYLLPLTPFLTDLDETGRLPATPREWTTEIGVGLLIALLVWRIHRDYRHAHAVALTDALTGLGNRRAFDLALENETVRSERLAQSLCLVYVDLDKFKSINDDHGHAAGDQVLAQVGAQIAKAIRRHVDLGFRLGGDEFAMLLPGSSLDDAAAVLERIRAHCAPLAPGGATQVLQISAGVCQLQAHETVAQFVRRADAAMYAEKRAGAAP